MEKNLVFVIKKVSDEEFLQLAKAEKEVLEKKQDQSKEK